MTRACQGVVFKSLKLVKILMEKTHTKKGLNVFVNVVRKTYETGRKVAKDFKNIVIFLTDDMGYANLQNYGNPKIRTPHIDSLADYGIRFTSYLANASCAPSRTQLLTGVYFP
jgi:hypothetical protein